jgi:hypothetical protein
MRRFQITMPAFEVEAESARDALEIAHAQVLRRVRLCAGELRLEPARWVHREAGQPEYLEVAREQA